jgi:hypothetical protein
MVTTRAVIGCGTFQPCAGRNLRDFSKLTQRVCSRPLRHNVYSPSSALRSIDVYSWDLWQSGHLMTLFH